MTDWQIGDLALCVEPGDWFQIDDNRYDSFGPTLSSVHVVIEVSGGEWLGFGEFPDDDFSTAAFRKILPDKHEACEAEFVTLLKRGKVST